VIDMAAKNNDREFMKIAISEMHESRSEHENKYDPMVGAVLVDDNGNVIDKAHRGDFRVGEHAEYTLIERILPNRDLEGTTLYVTLEPCSTRHPPKKSCAERIVSARIKRVIIGTLDPNPEIHGKGIVFLQDNNIEVDFFDIDLIREIRNFNKDFINQYDQISKSPNDAIEKFEGTSEKEKEPVIETSLDDLSQEIIREYLNYRNKSIKNQSSELNTFLYKNGFLSKSEFNGSFLPTTAGLLLFGTSPEDSLTQSKIKLEAHHGKKIVTSEVVGPILMMPDKIKKFLDENMRTYTEIKDFKRVEVPEYPWEAIREAVINAIVHRDYNEGQRIIIQLLKNKLIIKSPGLPLHPLSLEKIRSYNVPSLSRNPRIAEAFCTFKLMEERGWGLNRMRDLLIENKLPLPEFTYESGYFVVTFFSSVVIPEAIKITPNIIEKMTKRQREMIEFIYNQQRVTSSECAIEFKISRLTARRDLNKLIELKIIERKGVRRNTYYIINKDILNKY
jgi:ATP-dependent DNA helicase RecG